MLFVGELQRVLYKLINSLPLYGRNNWIEQLPT